ncbi:MAG: (Fe-S)-binding protein [Deltaproteobacteria bacterium]|nr:(Fe-S)-binding protein [Deltaproteobacteria bacterium]
MSGCVECGLCLLACPNLQLSPARAVEQVRLLRSERYARSPAFQRCNTCNRCELVCPERAAPFERMLDLFADYRRQHGLGFGARLVLPSEAGNLWSCTQFMLPPEERAQVQTWHRRFASGRRMETLLLTDFYTELTPHLASLEVLAPLEPCMAGSPGLWGCGGDSHKLGLRAVTASVARLLEGVFERLGVRRVITFMQAEAAMLETVLPERYGARFSLDSISSLDEWLLDGLRRGEIRPGPPSDGLVTIHDHCMSRYAGGKAQLVIREIVDQLGLRVREMVHSGPDALCCGWADAIPGLFEGGDSPLRSLLGLLRGLDRRLREAEATGAQLLVTSCPACHLFLHLMARLSGRRIRVRHLADLVDREAGSPRADRDERMDARSADILAAAVTTALDWLRAGRKGRFDPRPPPSDRIEPLPHLPADRQQKLARLSARLRPALGQPVAARAVRGAIAAVRLADAARSLSALLPGT